MYIYIVYTCCKIDLPKSWACPTSHGLRHEITLIGDHRMEVFNKFNMTGWDYANITSLELLKKKSQPDNFFILKSSPSP